MGVALTRLADAELRGWLEVIGTVGAVLVALFLQLWLPWWRRPKVRIALGAQPEVTADGSSVIGHWYDVRVENIGRAEVAREVEVVIADVFAVRGSSLERTTVPRRALKWTHVDDGRCDIPAGFDRSFMLGAAWPGEATDPPKGARFEVGTWPKFAHSQRHVLFQGKYRIELSVVSANSGSHAYVTELEFDDDLDVKLPGGVMPLEERGHPDT